VTSGKILLWSMGLEIQEKNLDFSHGQKIFVRQVIRSDAIRLGLLKSVTFRHFEMEF